MSIYRAPAWPFRDTKKRPVKAHDPNKIQYPWYYKGWVGCLILFGMVLGIGTLGWALYRQEMTETKKCQDAGGVLIKTYGPDNAACVQVKVLYHNEQDYQ
jgi:hypothetical protein